MLVLDTNHLVEFDIASRPGELLKGRQQRAAETGAEVATTFVNVEEPLRGWLAQIHRVVDPEKLIAAYGRLQGRIDFFARWHVLPFHGRRPNDMSNCVTDASASAVWI